MGKITIQGIADMCSVSKSSVSRYLNGGYVSEKNKEKIKNAIEQTGFETNFFAKRLKSKKSGLIGVVVPTIDSRVISKILTGINKICEENDYTILMQSSNLDFKKELHNINSLYNQGVDGIIVYSMGITTEHIELIKKISTPVVFLNGNSNEVDCINVDDYTAGKLLAEYFHKNNHKDIVFLTVTEKTRQIRPERKLGFYEYYEQNVSDYKIRALETDFSFKNTYNMGKDILNLKPTAVVCSTEHVSTALMLYLKQNGVDVPNDISIGGFGDNEAMALVNPIITTMKFEYDVLGEEATKFILNKIFKIDVDKSKISIPVHFQQGSSVKKI